MSFDVSSQQKLNFKARNLNKCREIKEGTYLLLTFLRLTFYRMVIIDVK